VKRGAKTPKSVEEYFAALSAEQRAVLEKLRRTIQGAAPTATDAISYQMPAFTYEGRGLVSYAAFKDHFSLFPMSLGVMADYESELQPFVSGKGTIRFTADRQLPVALVRKIVRARMEEIDAKKRR